MSSNKNNNENVFFQIYKILNDAVLTINSSKIFAGIMLIILNISSKFISINLSKTMEAYLKYTFSTNVLIFSIVWIGTRDIVISFFITFLYYLFTNYIFNEKSNYCCFSEQFTSYHLNLLDKNNEEISEKDIQRAIDVLKKAKEQNRLNEKDEWFFNAPILSSSSENLRFP